MWEAIRGAQSYVWISTFILEDDTIGKRTIHELTEAAKRGVRYLQKSPFIKELIFQSGTDLRLRGFVLDWHLQAAHFR